MERKALRRDKERLTAKVKTLEREAAERARAPGGRAPGPRAEGEADGLTAERGGGGGGRPTPPALGSSWTGRRHGMRRLRRRRDKCGLSPLACAGPCCRATRRSRLRRWRPTWPRSLLPTHSSPPPPHSPPPHGGGDGNHLRSDQGAELPGLRWPEFCSGGGGV